MPSSQKKEALDDPKFGCPTASELVDLYVDLSEPADPKPFQDIVNLAQQDPEHNICVVQRTTSGRLVGFLRAWMDPTAGRGVVYDIVVSPDRRGEDIAKNLLTFLQSQKPVQQKPVHWKGDSRRVAPNLDRHLAVVRTLYAVALTFGYQKVVDASYVQFLHPFSPAPADHPVPSYSPWIKLILFLLVVALGFLGVRLFWATGNIRRFVLRQIIFLNPPGTLWLLVLHFPLLLLHAVLFFFLCRFFQDLCLNGLYQASISGLTWIFVSLLALNVFWLFLLRTGPKGKKLELRYPELNWTINNTVFGLVALSFVVYLPCLPLSDEWSLFIVTALILGNTAINFTYTGRNYILGDAFGGA